MGEKRVLRSVACADDGNDDDDKHLVLLILQARVVLAPMVAIIA